MDHTGSPPGDLPLDAFGELPATLGADADARARYERTGEVKAQLCRRIPVARKVVWTVLCLAALLAVPYLHPTLRSLRLAWPEAAPAGRPAEEPAEPLPAGSAGQVLVPGPTDDQQARGRELEEAAQDGRSPIARARTQAPALARPEAADKDPPRPIDDPSGRALDKFFATLRRVESKEPGAVARIAYYGDSIIASDFVTGKLRRLLQQRFGDAGHGHALIANAWPGWFHIDVARQASAQWQVSTCVGPYAEDGIYGLGCASFIARYPGIWSRIATADAGAWGRRVARFEIEYLRQPGGGAVALLVDGQARGVLETAAAEPELGWHRIEVPDGPHRLEVRTVDRRPVRLFGLRMERDGPGVVVSALGITGARARFLDKQDDAHWARALRAAAPDLVVLAFGTSEIGDGTKYPIADYERTLVAVMKQVEAALPEASFMLVGPPDMASRLASLGHSRPHSYIIASKQREIAASRGWAFWDQFAAMGGGGSMWSWIEAGLGSPDMMHPTGLGGSQLGSWEYQALMQAYARYKARR